MSRSIDATTLANVQSQLVYPVWILRLDVQGNPVYIHTGIGNLTFASGSGYDPALVGFTFLGMGNIGSIDAIVDSIDGSQTLNLILPGVDLTQDYLKEIMTNGDLWQGYWAYVFLATFTAAGVLSGKPCRIKTARMDKMQMDIDPDNGTGTITVSLESQQSYSGDSNNAIYADQKTLIDSTDTSQDYVASLVTKIPGFGTPTQGNSGRGASGNSGQRQTQNQ